MLQHSVKGYGEIILFRIRNKTAFCVTIFNIYSRITMPCRNHIGRIYAVIILFDRVSIVITNHSKIKSFRFYGFTMPKSVE